MARATEQRAATGALNAGGAPLADTCQKLAYREFLCFVAYVMRLGLPPKTPNLATAVFNYVREHNPFALATALEEKWAESIESVVQWLSNLNDWFSSEYDTDLFEEGPLDSKQMSVAGDEVVKSLQQSGGVESTASSIHSTKNKKTVSVSGAKTVSVSSVPEERSSPQPIAPEPKTPTGPLSVVELLEKGFSPQQVRDRISKLVHPDQSNLASLLNKWLATQDPPVKQDRRRQDQLPLETKQAIAHVVEVLCLAINQTLHWHGRACRLEVDVDAGNQHGNFRLRAVNGGASLIKRTRLTEMLPLQFGVPSLDDWSERESSRREDHPEGNFRS